MGTKKIRTLYADGIHDAMLPTPEQIRAGAAPMFIGGPVGRLEAAENSDGTGKDTLRRFAMEAYNGGTMRFWWAEDPVVVDVSGLEGTDRSRPIFKDHSPSLIIGHTTSVAAKNTIALQGVVSGAGRVAQEVVESSDNGFPWQASIGVDITKIEFVEAGVSVTVNGQDFEGPLLVVRQGVFKETSFVALGADDTTTAAMLAAAAHTNKGPNAGRETSDMEFEIWLKAQGWSQEQIDGLKTDSPMHKTLMAAHEASLKAENNSPTPAPAPTTAPSTVDLQAHRDAMATETERVAAIRAACNGQHPKIEAEAIKGGWTAEKAELHVLRASRPQNVNINMGAGIDSGSRSDVLRAAAMQSLGMDTKGIDEQALNAADERYRRRMGLQDLLLEAAWANGYSGRSVKADLKGVLQAAFSDTDISGILSNVANKSLLDAYMAVEDSWRQISAVAPVSDFKQITRYRLTGSGQYEKVSPTGEIKHGELGQLSYTNQADTYAKMFALTRVDIINDDLGALQSIPRVLGRGAALAFNEIFWTEFMNNAAFFAAGNNNYLDGVATALGIDSLTDAEKLFFDQVDADGKPLGVSPARLLVPNALNVTASTLMRSTEVRDTTANTKIGTTNPHAGKFDVVRSSYLGNAAISGNSVLKWYLLANPADVATIEAVFLNGQEMPTIESSDADFNQLGIQMRGYHDFGVSKQDFRGGVALKGEA